MKRYIYIYSLIILTGLLTGCSDDFFDRTPTETITPEALQEAAAARPDLTDGLVAGMYSSLFAPYTGGYSIHSDFGQKSVDIVTDELCGDIAQKSNVYGHFYDNEELKSATRTSSRSYQNWRYNYRLIKAANDILFVYADDQTVPESGMANWGQAKLIRAFAYYNLVNLYAKGYNGYEDVSALPIYDIKNMSTSAGKSTVKEVYDFARKDVSDAIIALEKAEKDEEYTGSITNANKYVAQGLLAYIQLATGNYKEAISAANEVIGSGKYSILSSKEVTDGMNTVENPSWMWGVNITKENTGSLATFWGHMDYFTYGYVNPDFKMIDSNLITLMKDNDVRRYQFHASAGLPLYKFYDSGRVADGDKKWDNDIFWMRFEEMYLIAAEASFRLSGAAAAQPFINILSEKRAAVDAEKFDHKWGTKKDDKIAVPSGNPEYTISTIDDIYTQWRIECWGEGKAYYAMKRLKMKIVRGANHPELPGEEISYDDDRLTFPIPENEIINNPKISD